MSYTSSVVQLPPVSEGMEPATNSVHNQSRGFQFRTYPIFFQFRTDPIFPETPFGKLRPLALAEQSPPGTTRLGKDMLKDP